MGYQKERREDIICLTLFLGLVGLFVLRAFKIPVLSDIAKGLLDFLFRG
jgi:hypothetical protein